MDPLIPVQPSSNQYPPPIFHKYFYAKYELRTSLTKIISLNVSSFTNDDSTFYDRIILQFGLMREHSSTKHQAHSIFICIQVITVIKIVVHSTHYNVIRYNIPVTCINVPLLHLYTVYL